MSLIYLKFITLFYIKKSFIFTKFCIILSKYNKMLKKIYEIDYVENPARIM